jgi:adenosylcobinamide-GDP ribazoletransferase
MDDIRRALSLLTTLPVRARWEADTVAGHAMAAYPLVGVLIGALLAGLAYVLSLTALPVRSPILAPALILLAWVLLTGALHLDGWADCCDALFVPVSRERRLEILKDPRLGSFGGVGLALLLLVKLAAIQGATTDRSGLSALVLAPVLARWAVVIAAFVSPLARPDGMAAAFRQGLGRREVILATVTAAVAVAVATWFAGWHAALLWAIAGGLVVAISRLATSRLSGLTGDVYGALIELVETVSLVVVCFL